MEIRLNAFWAPALDGGVWVASNSGCFVCRESTYPSRKNRPGQFGEHRKPWPAKNRIPHVTASHLLTEWLTELLTDWLTDLSSSDHSVVWASGDRPIWAARVPPYALVCTNRLANCVHMYSPTSLLQKRIHRTHGQWTTSISPFYEHPHTNISSK
jgi:hypothetical protein